MKNIGPIRERYMQEVFSKKLGALAANLARVSSFSRGKQNPRLLRDLLQESEYFIEWTVLDAPLDLQERLVQLQIALARSAYRIENNLSPSLEMSDEFQNWSEEILEASGLAERR